VLFCVADVVNNQLISLVSVECLVEQWSPYKQHHNAACMPSGSVICKFTVVRYWLCMSAACNWAYSLPKHSGRWWSPWLLPLLWQRSTLLQPLYPGPHTTQTAVCTTLEDNIFWYWRVRSCTLESPEWKPV